MIIFNPTIFLNKQHVMIRFTTFFTSALTLAVLLSCGNSKDNMKNEGSSSNNAQIISRKMSDFYAVAADSSWILRVQFDGKLYFEDINRNTKFIGDTEELHVAQGADVVGISAKNDNYIIRLSIDIVDCGDGGKSVDILKRRKDDKDGNNYSGCGYYRGNPRLHDIWAVESINGEDLNPEKFPKDIPHFEFNLTDQKMSGFAGCNQVFGELHFEYQKVSFQPLGSTKMYCAEVSDTENKILKIMRDAPVIYSLKGTKLILENRTGRLVLKKVD